MRLLRGNPSGDMRAEELRAIAVIVRRVETPHSGEVVVPSDRDAGDVSPTASASMSRRVVPRT